MYSFSGSSCHEITLPNSIEEIESYAFSDCFNLTSLKIPDNLENVGVKAFPNINEFYVSNIEKWARINFQCFYSYVNSSIFLCPFLSDYNIIVNNEVIKDVVLPGTIKTVNQCGFARSKIRTFTAHEGLKTIKTEGFLSCKELESISLPSTIENLSCTFSGCDRLKKIELKSEIPPTRDDLSPAYLYTVDETVAANCTLYVPKGSLEAYRTNEWWGQFKNIVEI